MENIMYGNIKENMMFGVKHSAGSQKIDLEWVSVWRAESKEIQGRHIACKVKHSAKSQKIDLEGRI